MNLVVQSIVRGSHDLFAAIWAGGLLVMALVVFPTIRSLQGGPPKDATRVGVSAGPAAVFMTALQRRLRAIVSIAIGGVFLTGVLLLVFSVRTGGRLDPGSAYGASLIAKIVLSVVMLAIAVVRSAKLRRLGDEPGDFKRSGVPLVFVNAICAAVVLILSGVAGALG